MKNKTKTQLVDEYEYPILTARTTENGVILTIGNRDNKREVEITFEGLDALELSGLISALLTPLIDGYVKALK